jgi:hypothetical protein
MRNMSFFMTTRQIIRREKTVTRRFGWWFLKPGDCIQAVEKCRGLKPGEKINKLAVLRVKSIIHERLYFITEEDCAREGFPEMHPAEFVAMLCNHYKCEPHRMVNRIEFEYVE